MLWPSDLSGHRLTPACARPGRSGASCVRALDIRDVPDAIFVLGNADVIPALAPLLPRIRIRVSRTPCSVGFCVCKAIGDPIPCRPCLRCLAGGARIVMQPAVAMDLAAVIPGLPHQPGLALVLLSPPGKASPLTCMKAACVVPIIRLWAGAARGEPIRKPCVRNILSALPSGSPGRASGGLETGGYSSDLSFDRAGCLRKPPFFLPWPCRGANAALPVFWVPPPVFAKGGLARPGLWCNSTSCLAP